MNQFAKGNPRPIKIGLHDPVSLADLTTSSIVVKPKHVTTILITPQRIESSDEVKQIPNELRKCNFFNEVEESSIFSIYSQKNCRYECRLKMAFERCHCIPWDFPHWESSQPICNRFSRKCFMDQMKNTMAVKNCSCPNDCSTTRYSYSVSSNPISKEELCNHLLRDYKLHWISHHALIRRFNEIEMGRNFEYNEICEKSSNSFAVVKFEIADQFVTKVKYTPRVTLADTLSNIGKVILSSVCIIIYFPFFSLGGTLGLFGGVSVLSLFEIIYWIYRLCSRND